MTNKLISWVSKLDLDRDDKILIAVGSFFLIIILVVPFIEPPLVSELVDVILMVGVWMFVILYTIIIECRFRKIEKEYKKIMKERRLYDIQRNINSRN